MSNRFHALIECFLFMAGDEGLTKSQLVSLMEQSEASVNEALTQMEEKYDQREDSGLTLKVYGGYYKLVTKAEYSEHMKRLLEQPSSKSMTQASLEVLAIIAYRQPVTRVEIDDIRGVKSEGPIQTLIAKGFVMEKGRAEGTGRAILYGTTELFLDRFGLQSLDDLPSLQVEEEDHPGETDLFLTKFTEAFSTDEEGGYTD